MTGPAVTGLWRWLPALALAMSAAGSPAAAVGLGPLTISGTIDGPREGFRLDILNPYAEPTVFRLYAVGTDDEAAQPRVSILPAEAELGPGRTRRILVIADDLKIGETYSFRVCAERRDPHIGIQINARVCSKITAHRVA